MHSVGQPGVQLAMAPINQPFSSRPFGTSLTCRVLADSTPARININCLVWLQPTCCNHNIIQTCHSYFVVSIHCTLGRKQNSSFFLSTYIRCRKRLMASLVPLWGTVNFVDSKLYFLQNSVTRPCCHCVVTKLFILLQLPHRSYSYRELDNNN